MMWYRKKKLLFILDNDSTSLLLFVFVFVFLFFFQGDVADEDIMDDMLSAENKGKDAFETFMRERLNSAIKDVFSSITLLKLKTFIQRKLKMDLWHTLTNQD